MDSVSEVLQRLQFTGRPVETMYLNADRAHAQFVGQLGAIESFARTAHVGGGGSIGVKGIAEVNAAKASEGSITYDMNDPTAQALVLREFLDGRGELRTSLAEAVPDDFVAVVGWSCLSRPDDVPDPMGFEDTCPAIRSAAFPELEQLRAHQEYLARHMTPGDASQVWLVMLREHDDDVTAASCLHRRWIQEFAFMS